MTSIQRKNMHRALAIIARILLAALFVFSGFVKAVDPLGTAYKIQDYCTAFQWNILYDYAKLLSFLLFSFEMVLGLILLLGLSRRKASWTAFGFLVVMSVLTLYLAIKNPIQDCGCFGDAVKLTNWQTFWKNIVLLALSVMVLSFQGGLYFLYGGHSAKWARFICLLMPLFIGAYSLRHLPLFDFRPYRIGNSLIEGMAVPDGAPADSIVTTYFFEKEGVVTGFGAAEIPRNDTSWHYLRREQIVVRKGYVPQIHDFSIIHPTIGDITEDVLRDSSYTFLWVSPKLETSVQRPASLIKDIESYSENYGYRFLILTSSSTEVQDEWNYEYDLSTPFCSVDETTLKTMIRSNPGLVLIKGGTVINKWAAADIESVTEKFDKPLEQSSLGRIPFNRGLSFPLQILVLFSGLLLFVYVIHLLTLLINKIHLNQPNHSK